MRPHLAILGSMTLLLIHAQRPFADDSLTDKAISVREAMAVLSQESAPNPDLEQSISLLRRIDHPELDRILAGKAFGVCVGPYGRWANVVAADETAAGATTDPSRLRWKKHLVLTGEERHEPWFYALQKPESRWMQRDFDASGWQQAEVPFSQAKDGLWLRRVFHLSETELQQPWLRARWDGDFLICLNGHPVKRVNRWQTSCVGLWLDAKTRRCLQKGRNVIAVYCERPRRGNFIDLGLLDFVLSKVPGVADRSDLTPQGLVDLRSPFDRRGEITMLPTGEKFVWQTKNDTHELDQWIPVCVKTGNRVPLPPPSWEGKKSWIRRTGNLFTRCYENGKYEDIFYDGPLPDYGSPIDTSEYRLELLYENDFSKPVTWIPERQLSEDPQQRQRQLANNEFVLEGKGRLWCEDGRLHAENETHIVFWLTKVLPGNFLVEFDYEPKDPRKGLAIVFFSATGRHGESIFDVGQPWRDGVFRRYVRGQINCYHTSYWAGHTRKGRNLGFVCNFRKDPGHVRVMLGPDYLIHEGAGKIRLLKIDKKIQLEVCGRVCLEFEDQGDIVSLRGKPMGPHYGGGHFGFRAMSHTRRGDYDNLKVWQAVARTETIPGSETRQAISRSAQ